MENGILETTMEFWDNRIGHIPHSPASPRWKVHNATLKTNMHLHCQQSDSRAEIQQRRIPTRGDARAATVFVDYEARRYVGYRKVIHSRLIQFTGLSGACPNHGSSRSRRLHPEAERQRIKYRPPPPPIFC